MRGRQEHGMRGSRLYHLEKESYQEILRPPTLTSYPSVRELHQDLADIFAVGISDFHFPYSWLSGG